jgi:pimeloyl-ACP methyl ester carboxylesterase
MEGTTPLLKLSSEEFFDQEALRTLAHMQFGGADLGECLVTMQRVPPGDMKAWYREWNATAERVQSIAQACERNGRDVSAREAWLRASNYYRTAWLMLFGAPTAPEVRVAFGREAECFRRFAALADPPLEPVEIPYEGTTLPGYFCRARGADERATTLIATNGYDGTLHEAYFAFAVAANRRGYHCLLYDGPGQGRVLVEQGLPMRHDWENVIRPVVDYALARPEVDPSRLALAGWSLGGYLALRGASGEPRLAACVADPGLMSLGEPMEKMLAGLPPAALADPVNADPSLFAPFEEKIRTVLALRWKIEQRAFWVHGVSSLAEYLVVAREFTNRDRLSSIRCPVFVAAEENDSLASSAQEVYDALKCKKRFERFLGSEGAGDHTAIMARSLFLQRMFDWLDEVLELAPRKPLPAAT